MNQIATIAQSLREWIEANQLAATFINDRTVVIPEVGRFLLIEPKDVLVPNHTSGGQNVVRDNVLFDSDFQILLNDTENELTDGIDYLLFQFGNRFYYTNELVPDQIKEFKHLGKADLIFSDKSVPHLGIHTGYELCNGSKLAKDWIKKAQFLGVTTLGICEENTLAGTLPFQEDCLKYKIKPIIGETVTILTSSKTKMNIKLYVQDAEGWENLLTINKIINVDNNGEYIPIADLFMCKLKGLICVLSPDVDLIQHLKHFKRWFVNLYYQIDPVEWSSNSKDEQYLKALKTYFDEWLFKEGGFETLKPILICDSYYLDKEDAVIKKHLNSIGKVGFKSQSADQHFKSIDEVYLQFSSLFKEEDERWNLVLDAALANLNSVCSSIDFTIPVGVFRLPEYEMNAEEAAQFTDNENLFYYLIEQGLETKILGEVKKEAVYFDRLEEEIDVIKRGGFISYFLILRDIINYCKEQNIWVGLGRGSAAGSLVSYLLDIVKIDPIHYNLLFSRFLNAGRIGKSLPDVDLDFEGGRRDEVKRYMETKYGADYVTAIGTYSTFKVKGAIKDLARDIGVDFSKTNFITSLLPKVEKMGFETTFTDLFKIYGTKNADFKLYLQKHHKLFEKLPLCLEQPKTASVHASGVVIVPKSEGKNIYAQMPVKKVDGVLVSEWEGTIIDKAGFLKFDILGVKQLDKFAAITKLILENTGEVITYDSMDLEDADVYDYFKEGFTEDVFQFGTSGLKAYCKELKPDNIEDLIAAVALYRPSTMESGLHKEYILIKNGQRKAQYDIGCYEATKETFGIAVYQEQVMQITKDVAGFDLIMADDVRKAMGKKDHKLLATYEEKFIDGGLKKGHSKQQLIELWEKLKSFASYGFNRSHAACYAIMGYFSQWLKVKYPIEFWTVAMQFAKEEEIIERISEISKISTIQIKPVDINKSTTQFYPDYSNNSIYWAMNSVKWVGEKGVQEIFEERQKGQFFSIEEFADRIKGKAGVNKRTITNLILSGAFDGVEKTEPHERGKTLAKYVAFTGQKLADELEGINVWKPYQWVLKQKELTGFGYIDFQKIVAGSKTFATKQKNFLENSEILFGDDVEDKDVVIAGILQACYDKPFKGTGNRGLGANLEIIDNTDLIRVTIWMDVWENIADQVKGKTGGIILLSGRVKFDSFRQKNCVQCNKFSKIEVI